MNENRAIKLLESRSSARNFSNEPLPRSILDEILESALRAPSAGNRQPWRIFIVRNDTKKKALAQAAYGQSFVAQAPVVCAICAIPSESGQRYGQRGRELYCIQDTAALTYSILLAAHFSGYAGCWVGAFDEGEVARVLGITEEKKPVSMIPLGKAASEAKAKTGRKPLSQVVTRLND